MKIHILGICGTFMTGIAVLAKQLGHNVSGSDSNFYQPMLGQLEDNKIEYFHGFDTTCKERNADLYIIGNVVKRGNKFMESILTAKKKFISGPEWLSKNILSKAKKVISVAGTHGKTTTTSILVHMFNNLGKKPSYLIGGIHGVELNSAKLNKLDYFFLEADEYDTAFFDKRPKFTHYWSDVFVVNNIEFDHVDIYNNIDEIKKQFSYIPRFLKPNGKLIVNGMDENIKGMYSDDEYYKLTKFNLTEEKIQRYILIGRHNVYNLEAAAATCKALDIDPYEADASLKGIKFPARRLESVFSNKKYTFIDDFAHHPTAIKHAIDAVKRLYERKRVIALFEPASNTMKSGYWKDQIATAFADADLIFVYANNLTWDIKKSFGSLQDRVFVFSDINELKARLIRMLHLDDLLLILSNGNFANLRELLLEDLKNIS